MVIIVFGLPGSGKTYFATALAARLKAVYISSDQLRRTIIRDIGYTPEEKAAVYAEMLRRTQDTVLRENADVVLDATFHLAATRRLFKSGLEEAAQLYFIEVTASEQLIRQRLLQPREDSDADIHVYHLLAESWQPEEEEHLTLWSQQDNLEEMLRQTLHHLNIVYDQPGRP